MTGHQLHQRRKRSGLTQKQAARALRVSQPYLSLLENGDRPLTPALKKRAVKTFDLAVTELPSLASQYKIATLTDDQLTADLSALGYRGFSHYKPGRLRNPADVLLSALHADQRDPRLMEATPWLALKFHDMDWKVLLATAKLHNLQNRLGFVTNVAKRMAQARKRTTVVTTLENVESTLERSRLDREDTLCNKEMTYAERRWLKTNRSPGAKRWRILTSLSPENARYAD